MFDVSSALEICSQHVEASDLGLLMTEGTGLDEIVAELRAKISVEGAYDVAIAMTNIVCDAIHKNRCTYEEIVGIMGVSIDIAFGNVNEGVWPICHMLLTEVFEGDFHRQSSFVTGLSPVVGYEICAWVGVAVWRLRLAGRIPAIV
jgi:hypothetical protein